MHECGYAYDYAYDDGRNGDWYGERASVRGFGELGLEHGDADRYAQDSGDIQL